MNENRILTGDIVPSGTAATKTAGSILRAAREREGLHVAALAVSMRVPVKKLEALESDRLDLLPDAVFVRALAAGVCRALKLDPAAVLELLPIGNPPKLRLDGRGINTPFDAPRRGTSVSLKDFFAKPTVVIVSLLLFAALGVYFFPEATHESNLIGHKPNYDVARAQSVMGFMPVVPQVVSATASESKPTVGSNQVEAGFQKLTASVSPSDIDAENVAQQPVGSAAEAHLQLSSVGMSTPMSLPTVSFTATGPAWVQVTDAKGVQLLSRTLASGESVGISGVLPLAVIVGRSDLTRVQVRGQSFDLSNVSQNNVARFEIKP